MIVCFISNVIMFHIFLIGLFTQLVTSFFKQFLYFSFFVCRFFFILFFRILNCHSACFEAICWYAPHYNWGATSSFSQASWNWKATYLRWDGKRALRLPANRGSFFAGYNKQTEQHSSRYWDTQTCVQTCILSADWEEQRWEKRV